MDRTAGERQGVEQVAGSAFHLGGGDPGGGGEDERPDQGVDQRMGKSQSHESGGGDVGGQVGAQKRLHDALDEFDAHPGGQLLGAELAQRPHQQHLGRGDGGAEDDEQHQSIAPEAPGQRTVHAASSA
jgi:hypothetical protein